jgi:hypothetical protein
MEMMMGKFSALIFIGFGLTAAGLIVRLNLDMNGAGDNSTRLDVASVMERCRELDDERRSHTHFLTRMNQVFETLYQGDISFSQACAGLYYTSRQYYPKFVKNLKMVEGDTSREKIARVILSHFRMKAKEATCRSEVVDRLRELEEEFASPTFQSWCREPSTAETEE